MITAVLLAAGESRRMGEFKQLLRLGDKTFVEHCVDNLLASRVDEVLVVTGHREAEVRRAIANRPVKIVHNGDYQSGMASSVKHGVRHVSDEADACIISLVDQPRIDTAVIDRLIQVYKEAVYKDGAHARGSSLIVIPTYEEKNGHPILLDLGLREEILAMDLESGLRRVVLAHSRGIIRVPVLRSDVLEDCDVPEDYQRLLKKQ
jgi:molybdenum cofactor cytidylyltransferase